MSFRQAVVSAVVATTLAANVHDRSYYESKFFGWMSEHNIKPESGEKFVSMLQNFANNDDLIESHNAQKSTYKLGHNKFSHMSVDEWKTYVNLGLRRPMNQPVADFKHNAPADVSTLATSIDWVDNGAVSAVKDQGQCGSCWSFSAVGALEGAYQIKYGTLQTFSEQNFVSCDNRKETPKGTDMGCNGGLMDSAFEWAKANGGVCTEADYPYTSGVTKKDGDCLRDCKQVANVAPKSYTDVAPNSDSAMMSALNVGPVAVAIQADQAAFQLYKSGVFTAACGDDLDHGVLAVGYGTMDGADYYRVKNSWGEGWGDKGYIYFARGISQKSGQCGILAQASYANL